MIEYFDCYAPKNSNADAIRNRMSEKVGKTQADRIVLSLEDSALNARNIKDALDRKPINGLKEVLVIKNGSVERIFPPPKEGDF
ncbi:hypothetical protein [Sorangium sp. So ce861]|uniref:CdiA C-terminal domain-containing protein n=1 Tax=Sorangium sp. So ce861 TaxID=3133323 RepID=UPI003F62510C